MCFPVKLLPMYFLLTSAKVKLWATPLFIHAKELNRPQNHQPLRQRSRPSYYKHNHAYYHATAILVLSCSKAYICLIKYFFLSCYSLSLLLSFWTFVKCNSFIFFLSPCANHHLLRQLVGQPSMQSSQASSSFRTCDGDGDTLVAFLRGDEAWQIQ